MSDAAFSATYSDLKLVKTRGVIQIAFEAPIEKAMEILEVLGGMPRAAEERWFGIARLNTGVRADLHSPGPHPVEHSISTFKDSKEAAPGPMTTTPVRPPLSQSAWLLCNSPRGRAFIEQRRRHAIPADNHINNTDEAKHVLRSWLGIASLSELDRDPEAASRYEIIKESYNQWLRSCV